MFRAIALKELRETWWIGLLVGGLLGLVVVVHNGLDFDDRPPFLAWDSDIRPGWVHPVPFEKEDWPAIVLGIGSVAAVVLGLWQTLVESAQGTWLFYLHRPADRRSLILSKLAIGLGLLLFATGLPLLLYALWAATPETHANPFEWWMTGPTLHAWTYSSVAYLAAFLCGLRSARWWVSRFFPAVFPAFLWLPIMVIPWTGWVMWLIVLLCDVVLLASILWVTETRDWA